MENIADKGSGNRISRSASAMVGSGGGAIIVRVKRHRNEVSEAPQRLCLVEAEARGSNFASLSISNSKRTRADNKVFVELVSTLDCAESDKLDERTLLATVKRSRDEEAAGELSIGGSSSKGSAAPSLVWMTQGRKTLRSSSDAADSFVVIDMACHDNSSLKALAGSSFGKEKRGIRVNNPISRTVLGPAISRALETGDFSSVFSAVEQGADVNYQLPENGLTALMAAALRLDPRTVSKLITIGADPELRNLEAQSARELLVHSRNGAKDIKAKEAAAQVGLLLQHATVPLVSGISAEDKDDADFVTDIYRFSAVCPSSSESNEGGAAIDESYGPIIAIPGITFAADGTVEAIFDYDSEWSDLAEDEDPDSNDERFFGNDYPDEDSDSENGLYADLDGEGDDDSERAGKTTNARFRKQPVGNVIRPSYINDRSTMEMSKKEMVQNLWGEYRQSADLSDPHQDRLRWMAETSGMEEFAVSSEFDMNVRLIEPYYYYYYPVLFIYLFAITASM
jgi:hypothetical protein